MISTIGVTFDRRMTEPTQQQVKTRIVITRKLTGSTWGEDENIPKILYTARETCSTVQDRCKVKLWQSPWSPESDSKIITGGTRTTHIKDLEKITLLELLDDRNNCRVQKQAENFKRLEDHQMHLRINVRGWGRLRRNSSTTTAKSLLNEHSCDPATARAICPNTACPTWVNQS